MVHQLGPLVKRLRLLCIFITVLLIAILIKCNNKSTNYDKNEIKEIKRQLEFLNQNNLNQNKYLMDQFVRQNDSIIKQMSILGESLRNSQDKQQSHLREILIRIEDEMNAFKKDNQTSLDKVNDTVNEKLQKTLDNKLNNAFETIVKNMSELGRSLNNGQDKQQKAMTERLIKLESDFDKIRIEILNTLDNIRNTNNENIDKLRKDNQISLEKINDTVNEKLQKTLDDKISKSFESVNKRLAEVYEGLGEMKNVAAGVSDLKNVLSNVKVLYLVKYLHLNNTVNKLLLSLMVQKR